MCSEGRFRVSPELKEKYISCYFSYKSRSLSVFWGVLWFCFPQDTWFSRIGSFQVLLKGSNFFFSFFFLIMHGSGSGFEQVFPYTCCVSAVNKCCGSCVRDQDVPSVTSASVFPMGWFVTLHLSYASF